MTLVASMRQAGIEWAIDHTAQQLPCRSGPDKASSILRVRVRLMAQTRAPAEVLLSAEDANLPLEDLLALALSRGMPDHPVYQQWCKRHGQGVVTLVPGALGPDLGERLNTTLRNYVVGPQSYVQYQAISRLAPQDWAHFVALVREGIQGLEEQAQASVPTPLTLASAGAAIQHAFVARADEVRYRKNPVTGRIVERSESEKFALLTLEMACSLTGLQDFVEGWTALLCQEVGASSKNRS